MKTKGIYIVLFLLSISFFGTITYQYRKADQIHLAQEAALNMQRLLEASDIFSSNLGSMQQYFRNFVAEPLAIHATNVLLHQTNVDSALKKMESIAISESELKSVAITLDSTYFKERDKMLAYINTPIDVRKADSQVAVASEAQMNLVWDLLFRYRNILKQGIVEKSNSVSTLSAESKRMALISIFLTIALVLSIISVLYGNRKHILSIGRDLIAKDNECALMRSLVDNTNTCMHIVDKEGKIIYGNKAFLNFFDLPAEDVLFKTFKQLRSPRALKFTQPELRMEHQLPPFEIEETVEIDGKLHHFLTRKYHVKNPEGEVFAAAINSRDVTQRILNEKGLEISRQEAEHARLTQEQFMANISHEIRTPMNGIMGMTDLLSETPLLPDQRDYLDTIKHSSTTLMTLINDILDFSKIEAGMLQLEQVPFKVSAVIEQSFESLRIKASLKKIYLTCNVDHKVPAVLMGDSLRLYQIVSNLLSNAIKFTTEGGVSISVTAKVFKAPAVKLIIKVCDTGIGIPDERINYIFQSFAQSSLDISRKFGGTGLGLTIVKQLVEMQGGSISVESKIGTGSCFIVEIPLETSLPESWSAAESAKFLLLRGKEVLVVEDNPINQKVISRTLENAGLIATVVDNGFTALDILKQREFHMIIMDIQMPEIDGRETTLRVRNDLKLDVPIIAMTASVSADDRDRCLAAGMDDYISKPFVKEDLFEKLLLHVEV